MRTYSRSAGGNSAATVTADWPPSCPALAGGGLEVALRAEGEGLPKARLGPPLGGLVAIRPGPTLLPGACDSLALCQCPDKSMDEQEGEAHCWPSVLRYAISLNHQSRGFGTVSGRGNLATRSNLSSKRAQRGKDKPGWKTDPAKPFLLAQCDGPR